MIEVIVIAVAAAAAVAFIVLYNRLVALKHRVSNAFAQIDVQLKRRHDLIPNLVEVAKNYMGYERATLEAVTAARTAAQAAGRSASQNPTSAQAIAAVAATEGALSATLGRFFGLVENYPDLKANQTMMQLAEELTSTENRIAFSRQAFNDAVMRLNVGVESFPAVVFAGALGFRRAEMLQPLEREAQREPPAVSF